MHCGPPNQNFGARPTLQRPHDVTDLSLLILRRAAAAAAAADVSRVDKSSLSDAKR